jgi:hypothetical protein
LVFFWYVKILRTNEWIDLHYGRGIWRINNEIVDVAMSFDAEKFKFNFPKALELQTS